jgi:two-component system phosphate regulon sensor histidine kinase PhoR
MCHIRPVDVVALLFIAGLVVVLGWVLAGSISRGRLIGRISEATGADDPEDVERRVRAALDGADEARWQAEQAGFDSRYLTDLLSTGIVRLRDDLTVEMANSAAHTMLDRRPGTMIGRPALEAFVDSRIEGIARTAMEQGSASGELIIHSDEGPTVTVRARRSPVSGVWLVIEDVSELRRLQQIRAEFIDNLSHELRTPLSTISLLAETAARSGRGAAASPRPDRQDRS